jgi:hypothetical protein
MFFINLSLSNNTRFKPLYAALNGLLVVPMYNGNSSAVECGAQTFDECVLNNDVDCRADDIWMQIPFFCGHAAQCWLVLIIIISAIMSFYYCVLFAVCSETFAVGQSTAGCCICQRVHTGK